MAVNRYRGRVGSYDPETGLGWVVPRSGEEGVMIRRDDWAGTVLYAGKKLTFRMIHRPDGIYALRVDASADI